MHSKLRTISALFVGFLMVGSLVVPAGAIAGALAVDRVSHLSSILGRLGFSDVSPLDDSDADLAERGVSPISVARPDKFEVVIGAAGNSLAAEQASRRANGLPLLDGAGQRAYVQSLRDAQAAVRPQLEAAGAQLVYTYQIVYNGFSAFVDAATLSLLHDVAGVTRIAPVHTFEPALDNSVPFLLGGKTNAQLGADGTGVTIAVIDTGIDYTHAGLGGSGHPADYAANDPTIIETGTFPTAKVIGGTDLVGETYSAGCPAVPPPACSRIPVPDPDPLDLGGHGSHVSGIAAGIGTASVSPGVAPGASLFAIKVFALGSTSSAVIAAALELAADPNGDGDTSDAVDIANMSLGGPFGRNTELSAVASNAAAELGVVVVASAGNGGDIPYITGAPAAASRAISVAAGNDPGVKLQLVTVANSNGADGNYESLPAAFGPSPSSTGTKSGVTTFVGRACSPLASGSLTDKIPLIERGICTFVTKIRNAQTAGAKAVVVYNQFAGAAPITMGDDGTGGDIVIPSVMLGNVNGLAIRAAIDSDTTFTLDPANQLPIPKRLQGFTSRGPRFNDAALKPDITAPGGAIFSVAAGTGTGGFSLSGTSMSSPHIAGAAALIRQLHPTWSVEEIKAVLMETTMNASPDGLPYPVSLMGAGIARVDVAAKTKSVVVPSSASFGVEEFDMTGTRTFTTHLEVRNKGTATKTFNLASAFLFPSDDEGSVQIVHPSTVTVRAGHEKEINLKLRVNFNALAPESLFEEYDGFVTLTEATSGGDVLRVPFHVIPVARAHASAPEDEVDLDEGSTFTVANPGIRATVGVAYQLGGRDRNEDLIAEAPGMPNDPDDWFDVRHFGARAFTPSASLGKVVEIGVTQYGRRSAPSLQLIEVFIDVDGGGPDYLVQIADIGLFSSSPSFTGSMAPAIFRLAPPFLGILATSIQFLVSSERNTAWQAAPFRIAHLNLLAALTGGPALSASGDPDFEYFVVSTDLETGAFDETAVASYNAFAPALDASPQVFTLGAGASATVTVLGSTEGGLLMIYRNNVAGKPTSQVIEIEVDDD